MSTTHANTNKLLRHLGNTKNTMYRQIQQTHNYRTLNYLTRPEWDQEHDQSPESSFRLENFYGIT